MYKVSFVDYKEEFKHIGKETLKAIKKALSKGDLILRGDVEKFEKDFANYIGTKYAVGVNSCTDALIIALKVCGVREGDEVITVSHTFWASIEAIIHCGAKPVLVDVGEDYNMAWWEIESKLTSKTKAILPVHFNGRVCDMERIMGIASRYNLRVVEDAAQAIGSEYKGRKAGSFGDAGCFSFYPSKTLGAYGDGGIITTNDPYIKRISWLLRTHGQGIKTKDYPILYAGWSSRLQNIQAAALNVKMKYLDGWIKRRKEIAKMYDEGLKDAVKIPPQPDEYHNDSYQNYVIRAERRDELFEYLKEKRIETLIKDPIPNHKQPAWTYRYGEIKLPFSEQLCEEVISLPMHPYLTDEQVNYVIKTIQKFYE
jgi:dTDP-4-amino-4,6-dideoxygalactose transaminase